ncbi:hypothetical protein ABW20_dc0110562 [Dactylellina cionopaga]|nr:hypothetical protein ABW20_dc0110562 [Dactylellina cionopaga]
MPVLVPRGKRASSNSGPDGTTSEECVYGYDLLYRTSYASIVYFQASDSSLKMARWYGDWEITEVVAAGKAVLGTPLAATMWGPQDNFRLYYLSPEFELREWCWDTQNGDERYDGALNNANVKVAPYSKLSAFAFRGANLRLYYQGVDNKIEEYTYGGNWKKGATLPGDPLPGTNLAYVNRQPSEQPTPSIRGYFQTVSGGLAEHAWERRSGWGLGDFAIQSAPFLTPIAATVSQENNFPKVLVYWLSVEDTILQMYNWRGWSDTDEVDSVSVVRGNITASSFVRDNGTVDVRVYATNSLNILAERTFRNGVWEGDISAISVGEEVTIEVVGA